MLAAVVTDELVVIKNTLSKRKSNVIWFISSLEQKPFGDLSRKIEDKEIIGRRNEVKVFEF